MFWLLSQPLRTSVSTSSSSAKRALPSCEPLYVTNTSHRKQETFHYEYPLHWVLLPTKNAQQNATLRPQARSSFWLLTPGSEHAHASLLPRLPRSWTVLLPNDIYIENLLRPLQLFYFHLWPIYLLSLVYEVAVLKHQRRPENRISK
jgi:hypothetical protein